MFLMFITGAEMGVLSSISTTGSSQIVNVGKSASRNSSSPNGSGSLLSSDSVTTNISGGVTKGDFQRKGSLLIQNIASESLGNSTMEISCVNKTPNDTKNSLQGTVISESHEQKASPQKTEAKSRTTSTVTDTVSNLQSSGNMLHLVKLVNSVSKVEAPQAMPPLISTGGVNSKSPPSVNLNRVSTCGPAKPGTHIPRQIAMKQPASTPVARTTSIVLNLKPGEPIPRAINFLGPDGKSVLLTLSDGGKQLVTPTGAPNTARKILIQIPSPIASSQPAPKQVTLLNIAPQPPKTTIVSPQGVASPVILLASGSSQKPVVSSSVVATSGLSISGNTSNSSESRFSVVSPIVPSTELGNRLDSSSVTPPTPTKVTPLEPKPSSSESVKTTGLSPHEAKIQKLKELIKRQEEAVNKLREKRRLEIERIRDPSLTSKLNDNPVMHDSLKSERPPLAEQKRPSSPFAVPLPPKKRVKEYDPSFKTNVTKATDSSVTPSEGAFIPNADDKAFVQLVGLENVVKSIK